MPQTSPRDDRHVTGARSGDVEPSTDHVLDVLGDGTRRCVLSVLGDADAELPVDTLARDVHERPAESPDRETPPRRTLAVRLYHVHLPKLADAGLAEFDQETGHVSPASALPSRDRRGDATLDRLLTLVRELVDGESVSRDRATTADPHLHDTPHES